MHLNFKHWKFKESQYLPTFSLQKLQFYFERGNFDKFDVPPPESNSLNNLCLAITLSVHKNGIYLTQRSGLNWHIIQVERVCSNDIYSLINSRTHFCWGGRGWARVHRRGRHPDRSHHCCHCHSLQWLVQGETVSRPPGSNWGRAKIQCHSKWNRATDPSWRIDSGWRCTSKPYSYLASIEYRFT